MPNVVVTDLEINYKERILYAATYGRGMWKTRIVTDPKLQLPVITSIEPPDNSTKVQPSSQLIIYFSKPVKKGTGNITVFEGGAEKETINVNSDTVVIEGHKVIINPSPFGLGKPVYIRYPEGTFLDLDNNKHKGIVTTTDWNFTITSSTAIGSISSNSGITISPNPTTSIIHIKSPSNTTITHISVYNNLGVLVSEKSNTSIDCCELNLSHFAKGLYNVVLNVDGKRVSERVILE